MHLYYILQDPAQECSALGFCAATIESSLIIPKLRLAKSPLFVRLQVADAEDVCRQQLKCSRFYIMNIPKLT